MSDVGLIIIGIVLAVIGYCIERFFTGIVSTIGKIGLFVGILVAVIGFILFAIHLIGAELLILPTMLA